MFSFCNVYKYKMLTIANGKSRRNENFVFSHFFNLCDQVVNRFQFLKI